MAMAGKTLQILYDMNYLFHLSPLLFKEIIFKTQPTFMLFKTKIFSLIHSVMSLLNILKKNHFYL